MIRKSSRTQFTEYVREGEYGPVYVVEGRYAGCVGYYDDDDRYFAIVYFGEPFESGYVRIRRSWLRKTTVTLIELEKWKRTYPEGAKQLGIP